jgi:hypothetical protein
MASTIHYSAITEPHLLDVVDEAWMRDTLPDDRKCMYTLHGYGDQYYCILIMLCCYSQLSHFRKASPYLQMTSMTPSKPSQHQRSG